MCRDAAHIDDCLTKARGSLEIIEFCAGGHRALGHALHECIWSPRGNGTRVRGIRVLVRLSAKPRSSEVRMDEVPALGEHTRAILTELGYDSETIDLLVTENAI